jgi:anti-sigma-K factor RskA
MTHAEITELLGAYALDAVDDDERALVEEHLSTCARCRAEVAEHREVATMLAHTGGDAPEGVWQRIAGSLDEAPPDLRLAPVAGSATNPPPTGPPVRRLAWRAAIGAVAASVVVVAFLGVQLRRQDQRIDDLQAALQDPLLLAFDDAVTDPDSRLIELASADGEVVLRGAITDDGVGYLSASPLPALPADRTYQLWGGSGDELVSLGVLGDDPRIVSFAAEPYELFAITEEQTPGVVTSRNPPVATASIA